MAEVKFQTVGPFVTHGVAPGESGSADLADHVVARLVEQGAIKLVTPKASEKKEGVATLTKQMITNAGVLPTYAAASGGGDNFTPDSDTFLHVKNGSGGSITVTVTTPGKAPGGLAIADVAVAVPAASERMVGPFPAEEFADPNNTVPGNAGISYSGVTSLTIACLSAPRQP